jgi:hypothetical protein
MTPRPRTLDDRFFEKVRMTDGCWIWTGSRTRAGYGHFSVDGAKVYAHRLSYERVVGLIPSGLEIDHLCRNRACVRPDHLEPVTRRVNGLRGYGVGGVNSRKVSCPKGHAYTDDNVLFERKGAGFARRCRTCRRERDRARNRLRRSRAA